MLTIADFTALPEDDQRWELQEGSLVRSPSPTPRHMRAEFRLASQLEPQLLPRLEVFGDVDIDLDMVPPNRPGHARRPDLIVVEVGTVERADDEGRLIRASEVLLVVEIVSPGSVRMDNVIKRGEYADAGIGHYWIIDLDPPVSMLACHLGGELGYVDDGAITGTHIATEPFAATIELDKLR
ncbi:MAG TPA: Uma2 family endonuclease [Pseudonocardiaceae bacterium]|nr:Uma2 family endonuclease [Pseudonocardiaceae bacterium]